MKKLFGKILFAVLFVALGASSITIVVLATTDRGSPVREAVVMEAGGPLPTVLDFLIAEETTDRMRREARFITDIDIFNQTGPIVGEFPIEIEYNGRPFRSTLVIRDTVPPRGVFVNRLAIRDEPLRAEDFVRDIEDNSLVTVSYYRPVDFSETGEQLVWVRLTDEGGNETVLAGFVFVLDGARTLRRELGFPYETVRLEQFIFGETERQSAVFVTDVEEREFDKPGLHPIDIWVMDGVLTFYINVADSLPPEASPVESVHAYAGFPIPAYRFVTDVFDHDMDGLSFSFVTEPDWSRAGERAVSVAVRDSSGNAVVVDSFITITEDNNPPIFIGLENRYVVLGGTVAFRRGVTAVDGRDGEVEFTVDASRVDTSVIGTHYVYYEAVDLSGNIARERVAVIVSEAEPEAVLARAREILDDITNEDMALIDKARAIYNWAKNNIAYAADGPHDDIITGAHNAFTNRRGDCYTFFAASAVMFDVLGIPNITMVREGGRNRHWWSIIDVGYGWHHFDATPHNDRLSGFHFTQERAEELTRRRGANDAYYVFNPDLLPEWVVIE